ncbi:hypothetical protein SAMN02746065_103151 [Desulfocicer vacuolatum DSM 3385]|uniref:Uncharacterized protein n=1 Tax=Desulfocicer vacuolatum DSM 3385 TaxID=1121400 RepID=A0A1W1ZSH4_9BACT|nr:hypothetical protein SAMN02746065_103151 [Desulfocicer vacuolatum DSM 3385]
MVFVSSGDRVKPSRVEGVTFQYPFDSKENAFKAAMFFDSLKRIF